MTQFNFMSGSSVDNFSTFMFDAFLSGKCYLGFAKGTPESQWGINTLMFVDNPNFPTNVSVSGGSPADNLFFDNNSVLAVPGSSLSNQKVSIGYVADTDVTFANVSFLDESDIGELYLMNMGKDWVVLQGLSKYYYNYMSPSTTGSYYLFNYQDNTTFPVKILNKSMVQLPYYVTNCNLYYQPTSGSGYTLAASGLQRTINILGETYISGLAAPEIQDSTSIFNDVVNKTAHYTQLVSAYKFTLRDESGSILIDDLAFVPPEADEIYTEVTTIGASSKYVTFSYPFINNELQRIKLTVGENTVDQLGIWPEALPYDSIIPIADANPPALDVSYLKSPLVNTSMFDVKGLLRLDVADIDFIKEVNNSIERTNYENLGFTIEDIVLNGSPSIHTGIVKTAVVSGNKIELYNFNGFVVGDKITLKYNYYDTSSVPTTYTYEVTEVDYTNTANSITLDQDLILEVPIPAGAILESAESDITAIVTVAKTKEKEKALKYGLYNIMITKTAELVGVNSPTEGIYRQLFVGYLPKDENGIECSDPVYNGDLNQFGVNFNLNTWTYDNGTLLYVSNKVPVYRKWASADEQFKIII